MTGFVNFALLCLVVFITCGIVSVAEGTLKKVFAGLCGAAVFVLVVVILPKPNEAKRTAAAEHSSPHKPVLPRDTAQSVDVTLRNYKEKGDSVQIECSGSTGNIICKPKK